MDLDNSYRAARVLRNFFSQFYEYMYEYTHTHTGNNLEEGSNIICNYVAQPVRKAPPALYFNMQNSVSNLDPRIF